MYELNKRVAAIIAWVHENLAGDGAPATESIAVALVEGARAHWRKKDKQDKSAGQPICTAIAARRVASRDGRNERIKRSV